MDFEIDEINYEDMDDLALPDHIEWNHFQPENSPIDVIEEVYGY